MTHIYYTVNSGLYFSDGSTGIFIDGIHGGTDTGFSPVHPKTVRECMERAGIFHDLKALLYTHCHSDHFDANETYRVAGALFVYTPEAPVSNKGTEVTVRTSGTDGLLCFGIGDFEVYAVRTRHDGGKPLCFTPHVSFVINTPDETFFAAGDAVFTEQDPDRLHALCRHPVKAAFVNPYQLLLDTDRAFLRALSPEYNVLIHLPLPQDDRFNAKLLYDNAVKKYREPKPLLLLPGFYTQIF